MTKLRIIKKTVIDKKKWTIISKGEIRKVDDKQVKKCEKWLNKAFKEKDKKNVLLWVPKEKKSYKIKNYTVDKKGVVTDFQYNWKDFNSKQNILKNVTISFRWKPSVDDKSLAYLLMNK